MEKQTTIDEIISKLRAGQLDDIGHLSDYLVILSASMIQAGGWETRNEIAYLKKWADIKVTNEYTDKMTDAVAKQSDEYRLYRKAKVANITILEVIRSLKKKLKSLEDEYASGQNY